MADETVTIQAKLVDGLSDPLGKVVGSFSKLEQSVTHLGEKLEPLTGKAESLITALGAGIIFEESLKNAEKEVEAEAILLNALRGRRDLLLEVEEHLEQIQRTSTAGREELLRLSATFANAGLSAEQIPEALTAALNTAKAIDRPVQTIADAIIRAQSGTPGRLAALIPELRDLAREGTNAGDVIKLLNDRFSGTAAAVAATPFGRVKQDLQLIEDVSEDFGKELIKIKAEAVDTLLHDLQIFDAGLGTNGFKALINVAVQLTPYLVRIAEVLVAISATAGVARLVGFFISLVSPLAAVATSLGVIGLVLGGIGLGLFALVKDTDQFNVAAEATSESFQTTSAYVADIVAKLADGRLKVTDLFDIVFTKVQNLGLFLKGFLIDPVVNFVQATVTAASAGGELIADGLKLSFLRLIDFLQTGFLGLIRNVALAFDTMINGVIESLNKLPGVDIAFRSNAAGAVPKAFKDLNAAIDQTQANADEAIKTLTQAYPAAFEQTARDATAAIDAIGVNNAALDDRLARSQAKNEEAKKQRADLALQDELTRAKRLDSELASQREALALNTRGSPDADPALKLQLLEEQKTVNDELLAAAEHDLILAQEKQQLVHDALSLQAQTVETVKAENDSKADTAAAAARVLQLERDRARVLADITTTNKAVTDETRKQASDVLAGLGAARQIATATLQENARQRSGGLISKDQREEQDTKAIDTFNAKAQETSASLAGILDSLPPEEAEKLTLQLQNLSKSLTPPSRQERGFFQGVVDGIHAATAAVDDLGKVGADVGNTLVSGLQDGIINVFIRGKESVSDWAGNLLQSIATIIERMLILEGIEFLVSAIGFSGGGSVASFAGGGQVSGARTGYDSVPARLTPGEYVMDTATVDHYGTGFMRSMQSRSIPRSLFSSVRDDSSRSHVGSGYAEGGSVSGRQPAGVTQAATIVASEQEMDRLLAGGGVAMDRYLDRRGYRRGRG